MGSVVKISIVLIILMAFLELIALAGTGQTVASCLSYLGTQGYTAYADPAGDFNVNDLLPNTDSTYDIGASDNQFAEGHLDNLYLYGSNPVTLVGSGKVYFELRPDLDFETVRANGLPTRVFRGVFGGFSLPTYAVGEELFFDICIPDRWDGTSSSYVHLDCWLNTAQDAANDAFRLQVAYNSYTPNVDVVPNTSTNVEVETTTGAASQFQSYSISFTVPAGTMVEDDILALRLRRIAVVTGNEIDGEIVVDHMGVIFLRDTLGSPTP